MLRLQKKKNQLVRKEGGRRKGRKRTWRETLVEDVDYVLDCCGDDAGTTGGADGEIEGAVGVFDDGGGHGAEGAFSGADVVCY